MEEMMKKIIAIPLLLIGLLGWPAVASYANPIVIGANAPVVTPIKPKDLMIIIEGDKPLSLDDLQNASSQFKPPAEVGPIQSTKVYWLAFEIKNDIETDREFRLTNKTFGLLSLNVYLIHENGERIAYQKNYATLPPGNQLSRISPFFTHTPPTETQYLVLPLRRNETTKIYARINPDQRFYRSNLIF